MTRPRRTNEPAAGGRAATALIAIALTVAIAANASIPASAGASIQTMRTEELRSRELPPPVPCHTCWQPGLRTRWQYQLQGKRRYRATGGINTGITTVPFTGGPPVGPDAFDIDLYVDSEISGDDDTVDTAAVDAIHQAGGRAVCYVDAGTWERWRPDADSFPDSVKGKKNGWPGERWLDIRRADVLLPLMEARVALCAQGGFDAVEFDNVDGAFNKTGFPLKPDDQLAYNAALANIAHAHALSVGLKNDVDAGQVEALLPYFDFSVDEQCFQYRECSVLQVFVEAGKPVFNVEYHGSPSDFCPAMNDVYDFNSSAKRKSLLDEPWAPCR
jgi:hypothetical protein